MDDPHTNEADTVRAMRFIVDVMITLTEDDISGADAVDLMRPLWDGRRSAVAGDVSRELDGDAMLAAWATIAGELAEMVAAERRANGRGDSSLADVWGHLQLGMSPHGKAGHRAQDVGCQSRESAD